MGEKYKSNCTLRKCTVRRVSVIYYHREIMYFIETKARCLHQLFGQFLGYTRLGRGGYFVDSIYSFNYPYLMWHQYPINKCSNSAELLIFCWKEKSAEILYILTPLHFEPTAAVQTHLQTFKGEVAKMDKTTCCLRLYILHYYSMSTTLYLLSIHKAPQHFLNKLIFLLSSSKFLSHRLSSV
jgi:hypothetical protein